ncbi:FAD-dependent monooxygenase [Nocardiopsis oceani]
MPGKRVLISGGGVGGPALAFWLHRYGFRPTIVEKASEVRTGGYRLQIEGAGIDALRRMGMLAELRSRGGPPPGELHFEYGGRREVVVPGASLVSAEAGLAIRRGELCDVLYRNVRDHVEYLFDDSVIGLQQSDDGVAVRFQNREPRDFDLVIGADGIHSNTRSLVFGPKERFRRYLGTNIALFDLDNDLGPLHRVIGRIRPGRGSLVVPFPGGDRLECTLITRDREPLDDVERYKDSLLERFADDGPEVARLLAAMDDSRVTHVSPTVQIHMDSWTSGRVALLGDAGYCPDPMTGQGSTLALVGACVLAGALARAGGDQRIAFPAYEAAMRDFVDANLAWGGQNTAMVAPDTGPVGLRLRSWFYGALIRVASRLGTPESTRRAYNFPLAQHVPV